MRHGKKINHLSRTSAQRKALLSGLATNLISNKRISTTVAKAKALKKYVEPLITKAKDDTTHSRRTVFSYLQDKDAVTVLFGEVAQKVGERPGGYTRIIKTGARLGDAAETCIIELVDFNEFMLKDTKSEEKKTTRRSRRGKSATDKPAAEAKAETKEVKAEAKVEEPKAEKTKEETPEEKAPKADTPKEDDSETK